MIRALATVVGCYLAITTSAQSVSGTIAVINDNDSIRFVSDHGEQTAIASVDMANYYFAQGIEAAVASDYPSAESKFRIANLYDDNNPLILYNLGLAQYLLGKYAEALATFNNAMRFDDNNKDIYNQRAMCNAILGDYDKAETDFLIMLQYDPMFPAGNYNYGILLFQMGEYAKACTYFRRADELGYENAPFALANFCSN